MTSVRIKLAAGAYYQLRDCLFAERHREGAAFALAGLAKHARGVDILIRRAVEVPQPLHKVREPDRVEVAAQAVNGLAALCERSKLTAVLCHSHLSEVGYSSVDDQGELRLAEALRPFVPPGAPVASLLLTPSGPQGRLWLPGNAAPVSVDEIVVVDPRIERLGRSANEGEAVCPDVFSRHVLAFGAEGQQRISAAKVAVVGVGGTGSCTAEQLVRLGVRDMVLVDPDRPEPSNLTRVYGTRRADLDGNRDRSKVAVVADHLRAIAPGELTIDAVARSVVEDLAAARLLDRDCIFLCTDDHWGRAVVNQLAYQYLIPVINLGLRIDAPGGTIQGAVGIVDILGPDLPCLWCRGFLDPQRIAAEGMPQAEREMRADEGYLRGYSSPQPAVVSLTTTVAGLGVTLFLDLLTGFMGDGGGVHRLNWNVTTGEVRRGRCSKREDCACRKVEGRGDLHPRPTILPSDH
jgi:hypothetical protein